MYWIEYWGEKGEIETVTDWTAMASYKRKKGVVTQYTKNKIKKKKEYKKLER